MPIFGEHHLEYVVKEYAEHYHTERAHQGLGNEIIEPRSRQGASHLPRAAQWTPRLLPEGFLTGRTNIETRRVHWYNVLYDRGQEDELRTDFSCFVAFWRTN
jgi:hypothetical protein